MRGAGVDDQLIGPFIFEGRLAVEMYLRFLQEELPHIFEDMLLNKRGCMYFQHDGASPHFLLPVINFFNDRSPGRWIGRGGPNNWPARCSELSQLYYCVMG